MLQLLPQEVYFAEEQTFTILIFTLPLYITAQLYIH